MMDLKRLKAPFAETEIEWRIQRSGLKNDQTPWAVIVPFVDARVIQKRLDEAVGPENWATKYEHVAGGVMCLLSIKIAGEWVTKTDGAKVPVEEEKQGDHLDPVKTSLTNAFKRAAVVWGIARELYGLEPTYAVISDKGKYSAKTGQVKFRWDPPKNKKNEPGGTDGTNGTKKDAPPSGEDPSLRKKTWEMILELHGGDPKAAGVELGRLTRELGGKEERFFNRIDAAIVGKLYDQVKATYEREMR